MITPLTQLVLPFFGVNMLSSLAVLFSWMIDDEFQEDLGRTPCVSSKRESGRLLSFLFPYLVNPLQIDTICQNFSH